jgi:transcriptional regulator GlxA family with amidase domain
VRPILGANVSCDEAHARWRRALGVLAVGLAPEPKLDPRIAAVLEHLRTTPSPPPTIGDLARIANLSERSPVTEAVFAAGFADGAHLIRTAVRMKGCTPMEMRYGRWLSNCR